MLNTSSLMPDQVELNAMYYDTLDQDNTGTIVRFLVELLNLCGVFPLEVFRFGLYKKVGLIIMRTIKCYQLIFLSSCSCQYKKHQHIYIYIYIMGFS